MSNKNNDYEDIIKLVLGVFLVLVGGGLVFTGIGILGFFFAGT